MNLLIFLDLTYNPCKNFKFYSLHGQNFKIFLIFTCNQGKLFLILPISTYNQGKVFLILPITRGGTSIPSLHWELPLPLIRMHSAVVLSSSGALLMKTVTENNRQQDALSDIQLDRVRAMMTAPGALKKASIVCFIYFNNLSHKHINETLPTNPSLTKSK